MRIILKFILTKYVARIKTLYYPTDAQILDKIRIIIKYFIIILIVSNIYAYVG